MLDQVMSNTRLVAKVTALGGKDSELIGCLSVFGPPKMVAWFPRLSLKRPAEERLQHLHSNGCGFKSMSLPPRPLTWGFVKTAASLGAPGPNS